MKEAYVYIESEIDVLVERADGKEPPIRLPGGTIGVYEKGLLFIIKAPPETDDAFATLSKSVARMTPSTRKYVAEKLQKILDEESED